jgi:hypothetical protein
VNSVDGTACALWPFLRDTNIFTDFKENIYNVKTYINHQTVNAVYTILCKSYDGRGRSSNTITNLVVIKQ